MNFFTFFKFMKMLIIFKKSLPLLASTLLAFLCVYFNVGISLSIAQVISDIFIRLLKLLSLPMIFLAITTTLSGIDNLQQIKFLGKKVIYYTIITTIISASIASLVYLIVSPAHSSLINSVINPITSTLTNKIESISYVKSLWEAIPTNIFAAFVEGNVIGIAVIAGMIGLGTFFLKTEEKKLIHNFFLSFFKLFSKLINGVIYGLPLAVWAFLVILFKECSTHPNNFQLIFKYLLCVLAANLIQGLVVLPIFLKIKGFSPLKVLKNVFPALVLAFFSKSSNATLPVTLEVMEKNMNIPPKISNFSLPLCSVINMNGCAAFILITILFISQLYGASFNFFSILGLILLSSTAAIGNAGVPLGCFFLSGALLLGMNMPIHLLGFILPFYSLLDMVETSLNVWSDCVVTLSVFKDTKDVIALEES